MKATLDVVVGWADGFCTTDEVVGWTGGFCTTAEVIGVDAVGSLIAAAVFVATGVVAGKGLEVETVVALDETTCLFELLDNFPPIACIDLEWKRDLILIIVSDKDVMEYMNTIS